MFSIFIEICVIFIEIRVNNNIIKSQFEETICGKWLTRSQIFAIVKLGLLSNANALGFYMGMFCHCEPLSN